MDSNYVIGIVIAAVLCLLLLVLGIVMLCGKGAFLIAGYNTMSKEKREKYNEQALCRFMGGFLILLSLLVPSMVLAAMLDIYWLMFLLTALVIVLSITAVIFVNKSARFRK